MRLLPVFDNGVTAENGMKCGMKCRNHRILRVATMRTSWFGIESMINAWLDAHKDVAVADMDIRPCGDGTISWAAVIQYYRNVKLCP